MNTESKVNFERARTDRQSRFNPIANLTPAKLTSALDNFTAGYMGPFARMMDAMKRRDDVLRVVAPKREGSPARRQWEILTLDTLDEKQLAEAENHKAALEFFYNNLSVTSAVDLDSRGGSRMLVKLVLQALGTKFSVFHIVWQPGPDGLTAQLVHCPLWFFENRTGKLRFLRNEFELDGEEMLPGEWLIAVYDDYLMEACAVAYMFKNLSLKDWLIMSQDFGKPLVEGITDAAYGSAEWIQTKAAVDALAADLRIVRSRSSELKLTDISRTGEMPYAPLVERMDRAMARLWRGADLSTMSSGEGPGLGGSLQGDEKDLLEMDDAAFASEVCQMGLDALVIEYVFGPGVKPLAYFKVVVPARKDTSKEIEADKFLLESGAPLAVRDTLERYNRSLPDAGEDLLKKPAPPPQPVFPPVPGPQPSAAGRPAPEQAANEADTVNPDLMANALVAARKARANGLSPVKRLLDALAAAAGNERLSDAEVMTFAGQMHAKLPDLAKTIDHTQLAGAMEAALGSAVLEGVENSVRARGPQSAANEITNPQPLADAVATIESKTPVGSILRTAEWQQVPLALRQRAQFSAGIENVRALQAIQEKLDSAIRLARGEVRADGSGPGAFKMDRTKFIADMREIALSEGLLPEDPGYLDTLQDFSSEQRLGLIYDTQMSQAKGFAYHKAGQDPEVLDEFPAQELIRLRAAKVPRDWLARWTDAGGQLFDGRFIAVKTDPIWSRISRFGTPWPPYDFNSGMGVEDVDRDTAEALGVLPKGAAVQPALEDFNTQMQASAAGLSDRMKVALSNLFGDQINVSGDTVKWRGQ